MAKQKSREAFLRDEYLDDGKGPKARMVVVTVTYLRTIIENWADRVHPSAKTLDGPEAVADDIMDEILDECEEV